MLPNDDTFGLASSIAHGNQRSRLRCQPHVRPGSDGVSDRLVHPDQQQRRFFLIDCWFRTGPLNSVLARGPEEPVRERGLGCNR